MEPVIQGIRAAQAKGYDVHAKTLMDGSVRATIDTYTLVGRIYQHALVIHEEKGTLSNMGGHVVFWTAYAKASNLHFIEWRHSLSLLEEDFLDDYALTNSESLNVYSFYRVSDVTGSSLPRYHQAVSVLQDIKNQLQQEEEHFSMEPSRDHIWEGEYHLRTPETTLCYVAGVFGQRLVFELTLQPFAGWTLNTKNMEGDTQEKFLIEDEDFYSAVYTQLHAFYRRHRLSSLF